MEKNFIIIRGYEELERTTTLEEVKLTKCYNKTPIYILNKRTQDRG